MLLLKPYETIRCVMFQEGKKQRFHLYLAWQLNKMYRYRIKYKQENKEIEKNIK